MKHKEQTQLPKNQDVIKPLHFDNINVTTDPTECTQDMQILFINPDGSNQNNAIFKAPNAYSEVLDSNRILYEARCRLSAMMFDSGSKNRRCVDRESVDYYNMTLSNNVINKMLDEIEYNCNIICAAGMHNIVKQFYKGSPDRKFLDNSINSILLFNSIRSKFNQCNLRHCVDMQGEYLLFQFEPENNHKRNGRPVYCRDSNILNTMLNLKVSILSELSYNYGGFINCVINSDVYDLESMCCAFNDSEVSISNYSTVCSFVIGCLNEQAQRDIAKMGEMIEISVINALHYFMNNVMETEYDIKPEEMPEVKKFHQLPDGSKFYEF